MKDLFSPATRRWIYNVSTAVLPLLITIGVVTAEVGGLVLSIIAAVLGVVVPSLASANVSDAE